MYVFQAMLECIWESTSDRPSYKELHWRRRLTGFLLLNPGWIALHVGCAGWTGSPSVNVGGCLVFLNRALSLGLWFWDKRGKLRLTSNNVSESKQRSTFPRTDCLPGICQPLPGSCLPLEKSIGHGNIVPWEKKDNTNMQKRDSETRANLLQSVKGLDKDLTKSSFDQKLSKDFATWR